jgi:hypothetical protein
MTKSRYDPHRHHRRSIRLKEYDYTQAGAYFVTICTQHRECLFGEVVDGEMVLNTYGRVVTTFWQHIPRHFARVELDEWVVMPNHMHGVIVITDNGEDDIGSRGEASRESPDAKRRGSDGEMHILSEPTAGDASPTTWGFPPCRATARLVGSDRG